MKKKLIVLIALTLMLCAACVTAGCTPDESSYYVTFKNYDGSVLQTGKLGKGDMPAYKGATPQKPSDDEYKYTFTGWSPKIVEVTDSAEYTAQFDGIPMYESGDGEKNNPYILINTQQLTLFAKQVNGGQKYTGKYFALGADIDLGGEEWTPIGTSDSLFFAGNFDGDGFVVKNLVITSPAQNNAGLFGYNKGVIQNLGVTDFSIDITASSSSVYAGGLVGHNNHGTITGCYATGDISAASTSSSVYAGGLIGYSEYDGNITGCYAYGHITASSDKTSVYAGGLIGNNNDSAITNCYAVENIQATAFFANAGGLVGRNYFGDINGCYAGGDITATSDVHDANAGGLIGTSEGGDITNCYAVGDTEATSYRGYVNAGGLIGNFYSGIITSCYAVGDVSADAESFFVSAGGLVGINCGTIKNCYASGDVSAISYASNPEVYSGGLVGTDYGATTNSFRYNEQIFYIKAGAAEYYAANNTDGTECGKADLNSVAFYTDILGWDAEIWDFSALNFDEGLYPALKP